MDWLGSDEVIHVGIGCKVLSLILEDDKVIGFGDSTFLFSCFVTFVQSSRYYIESFNLVLLGHCVDVYLTPFLVVISGVLGGCQKAVSRWRREQVSEAAFGADR